VPVYGEYVGQVDSPQTVELRPRVEGFLKEICFKEGSEVQQGALMFVIDPAEYNVALMKAQAALLSAEVSLAQAKNAKDIEVDKANVARDEAVLANAITDLNDKKVAVAANALARSQLDSAIAREKEARAVLDATRAKLTQSQADYQTRVAQADAQVAVAKAAVAEADLNLSYTKIYTPLKGRVGLAHAKIGALVGDEPSPPVLATVSLVDPVHVIFTISEREMFAFKQLSDLRRSGAAAAGKLPVSMILEDGSLYPHQGTLDFVDRALDASTGTLRIRAEFPNPEGLLRPGNYAKVRLVLCEKQDALLVTERALGVDQGGRYVLVVNGENVVEQRPVKTGPAVDGMVVIESGLKPDEKVIVKGVQRARPGRPVNPSIEEWAPVAAAQSPTPKPAKD
jgi:membrane fusion protein (multidrug efflux system)